MTNLLKGPFTPKFIKKIDKLKLSNKKPKTGQELNNYTDFVGHSFMIHNVKHLFL